MAYLSKKVFLLSNSIGNSYSSNWTTLLEGHGDSVSSLAFSSDGQLLASGSLDGLVQVWDTVTGSLKGALEGPGGGIEV